MKRFLLFCGSHYYPGGGWNDFVGSFDAVADAYAEARSLNQDWYHVVDSTIGEQVSNDHTQSA